MRLTLLHTNDLHGHVDELARLVTQARTLRNRIEAGGEHCLLIDCGDAEERTPFPVQEDPPIAGQTRPDHQTMQVEAHSLGP